MLQLICTLSPRQAAEDTTAGFTPFMVRVLTKPHFRPWQAVLFQLWQDRLTLLALCKVDVGAVLAIQLPGDEENPGAVLIGEVVSIIGHEGNSWRIGCTLRQPLPREDVLFIPTLFTAQRIADRSRPPRLPPVACASPR
jgi:hypothetical protein